MQKIRIDFDNPGLPQHISAVENDSQSRFFQATLYENGKAYTAPEGATYSIMYRGFGPQNQGWYDTINDGAGKRAACAVSGNVVTCEIARQALQVPGHVSIVLCVTTGKGYMLKSWPIECDCKNNRYDSTAEIQSFFYITQVSNADWNRAIQALEELKNIIDPTLSVSGKAADAAKVGEAVKENAKGVSQLKEDKVDKPSVADDGKIPRAKEGEVEWVEVGQPTDNQTDSAVAKWLDNHPEATTTVQDDSLDEKKLQKSFRSKIKKTYRTFQDVLKDTSLGIGTFIETYGFYNIDDGGGGLYLVSSYAPTDENPCYFSYFDKYIVYIAKENVCNALSLGIKKDGSTDCSDIINKFFASNQVTSKRYYTLYFPAGVYLFTKPIIIENDKAYANIFGCASSRGTYNHIYNEEFYPKYSASIFAFDLAENTTAMSVNIARNGSFNMNGITFASKSSLFKSEGYKTRPTVPYNVFSMEKKVKNVNGLNIERCYMSSVENCSFIGFSGYGLRSYSHNIVNCFFSDCSIGVENNRSDLMLFNCYITRCENGIKAGSDGVIWASNTFIDQCVEHGVLSENDVPQTTLVLNGCIIDHIGYSGICVDNALNANIDARMGRCGMYYAGKTTGFSDMTEDEKKKAVTIYYENLNRGNLRLNIYKRSITDDSTDIDYVLPYVVFGGTYNNTVVTGLHAKDYLLFCNEENVHNTTLYVDDGIHTYA